MGQSCATASPPPRQQVLSRAASSDPAALPPAAASLTATAACNASSLQLRSVLDRFLMQQALVEELLLPTPINLDPIHLPAEELLQLIGVQQWVHDKLQISLPLFDGMFVLVPSAKLQQPLPAQLQEAHGDGRRRRSCSSTGASSPASIAALHTAIPWRLRQVLRVEVAAGAADPADATVVLVGGDRVAAGAVRPGALADAADYEYLCYELAYLQQRGLLRQLQVFDVAHIAWRMRIGCEVAAAIAALDQEQVTLSSVEASAVEMGQAAYNRLQDIRSILRKLPALDWVETQVLQHVKLNPGAGPHTQGQLRLRLPSEQYTELLQGAAGAWQHYLQCKLAGQQPQPAADMVPWLPLPAQQQQQQKAQTDNRQQTGSMAEEGELVGAVPSSRVSSGDAVPRNRTNSCCRSRPVRANSPIRTTNTKRSRSRSPVVAYRPLLRGTKSHVLAPQLGRSIVKHGAHHHDPEVSSEEVSNEDCGSDDSEADRVEVMVQVWLQQLAVRLADRTEASTPTGDKVSPITLSWLCQNHRLPQDVVRHYGCATKFVIARPELTWLRGQDSGQFILKPQAQQQLLAVQSRRHEPDLAPPADEHEQSISFMVRAWLAGLALLLEPLQPPKTQLDSIKLRDVKRKLPLPGSVIEHYGSVRAFVDARPELRWVKMGHRQGNFIALVPEHHLRLLKSASAKK